MPTNALPYRMLLASVPPLPAPGSLGTAEVWTPNWRPEIFNYFVYPVTNAYTESANGVAKVLARMGRGYSFDAIRAKVLFGQAKHKRPKFGETFGVSVPHLVRLDRSHTSDTLNSE